MKKWLLSKSGVEVAIIVILLYGILIAVLTITILSVTSAPLEDELPCVGNCQCQETKDGCKCFVAHKHTLYPATPASSLDGCRCKKCTCKDDEP